MCQMEYEEHNIVTSDKIVQVARSWIGTKFHHHGRVKNKVQKNINNHLLLNGGVDCLGLIIGIAKELNLKNKAKIPIADLDTLHYAQNIQNDKLYLSISENLVQIPINDIIPGDIICFKICNFIKHVAIYSYEQNIIHVTNHVIEHKLIQPWDKRIHSTFRFYDLFSSLYKLKI